MTGHASRKSSRARSFSAATPATLVPILLQWFAAAARDLPWRRTRDPYAIWVSEIMLQQTQVKTVIPYWERWLRELPDLQSLAAASPEKIHKLWEGLGYYTRVRNMQKAAQLIVAQHNGRFPTNHADILALPGIGRYTAGAIASIAFNQPAPILDGNVIRVLCRLHGIGEDPLEKKTNTRLWRLAEELVTHAKDAASATDGKSSRPARADNACSHLNQSLMELGALICTPRSPNCAACPVAAHCTARREDRVEALPRPKERAAVTARRFVVFVLARQDKFLVQQRGPDGVNAHLWEFPNCEADLKESAEAVAQRHFQTRPELLIPLCVVNHSITRYRIRAEAHRLMLAGKPPRLTGVWRTLSELRTLPFTSAHRQIADRLEKLPATT
jgi:A/G-specific adenine glycosylase